MVETLRGRPGPARLRSCCPRPTPPRRQPGGRSAASATTSGWDHDVADHPLLDVVHADAAVPEFRWGILTAVTFWRVVSEDNSQVVRHLERHEPGVIFHGLYRGSKDKLGVKVDMADDASTG